MTIFLELAKTAITSRILKYRNGSSKREGKPLNWLGSKVGLGYNPALSEAKRVVADELIAVIREVKDSESDKETEVLLRDLIWDGKDNGKKASKGAHKKNEGTFGPILENIASSVTNLYRRLKAIDLLDIPKDNDPYKILQFYMACYLAEKIAEEYKPRGLITEFVALPQITNSADLAEFKNDLVVLGLARCQNMIPKIVNTAALFEQRRDVVRTMIENIRIKNKEACNRLGPSIPIPLGVLPTPVSFLNVGGLDATFSFDPGDLEKCLEMAERNVIACKYIPGQVIRDVVKTETNEVEVTGEEDVCYEEESEGPAY